MGHSCVTLRSLSAASKARTTFTTTLLRSLAGRGGGFDTPTQKCPPDRGSSDWVTDSPAPIRPAPLALAPFSSRASSHSSASEDSDDSSDSLACSLSFSSLSYPPTPPPELPIGNSSLPQFNGFAPHSVGATAPKSIPSSKATGISGGLATPPLTPPEGHTAAATQPKADDTFDILSTFFPRDAARALPHSRQVSIDMAEVGAAFSGVVLALPGSSPTLYVDGKQAAQLDLRTSIVALLDLADEQLGCTALVIALERNGPALGELLHALMYVGGSVVTRPPFEVNPAFVLVGLEI